MSRRQILKLSLTGVVAGILGYGLKSAQVAYGVAPTQGGIFGNNISLRWKDSAGNAQDILWLDASNNVQIGYSGANSILLNNALDVNSNFLKNVNYIQLNAIADASAAGKLFLSSTTVKTMKYYDVSSGLHSIVALDLAQTFTGAVTLNSPTLGGSLLVGTDASYDIGTATNRLRSIYASTQYRIYAASADSNPTISLESQALKFGAGGGTTLSGQLTWGSNFQNNSIPGLLVQPVASNTRGYLAIAPSGNSAEGHLDIFGTNNITNNSGQFLSLFSDSTTFYMRTDAGSGQSNFFPLVFQTRTPGGTTTEIFRLTTTPNLQLATDMVFNADGTLNIASTTNRAKNVFSKAVQVFATGALTIGSVGSLIAPLKSSAGAPADSDGGNLDGAIVVSSGDTKIYVRVGGAWKGVAVT